MPSETKKIILLYLGKRGGGLNLYLSTLTSLLSKNAEVISFLTSSSSLDKSNLKPGIETNFLYSPRRFRELLNPSAILLGIKGLAKFIFLKKNQILVFVMASPFDYIYYLIAKIKHHHVITCIHDFRAHPGEKWPTARSLHFRLVNSASIVTFSKTIGHKMNVSGARVVHTVNLPDEIPLNANISNKVKEKIEKISKIDKPKILLIGRMQKYQNANTILKVSTLNPDLLFILAGELKSKETELPNLVCVNQWLSNNEFDEIMNLSTALIFPYTEASQSGTIPVAINKNKWIIAADHPGFLDQLSNFSKKIIFSANDFSGLNQALIQFKDQILNTTLNLSENNSQAYESDLALFLLSLQTESRQG